MAQPTSCLPNRFLRLLIRPTGTGHLTKFPSLGSQYQAIKFLVLRFLAPSGRIEVIPGLLELTYVENTGAAFGLFKNMMWMVVAITVVVSAAIVVLLFRYRHHTLLSYATSALLVAGGIGNLIDRFLHGFVVDYIHVLFFDYIFNLADCCITVGAVLFVLHVLFFSQDRRGRGGPSQEREDP